MGIVRNSINFIAKGFLLLPLILASGAPGAQEAAQVPNKQPTKQETPKQTRSVKRRVWTNDDFPSSQAPAPASQKAKEAEPKPAPAAPPDAETEKYLKMTPEDRQGLMDSDESDIQDAQERVVKLRQELNDASDEEHRQPILREIERMEKGEAANRREVEILRKLSPPKPQKKDSEKAAELSGPLPGPGADAVR